MTTTTTTTTLDTVDLKRLGTKETAARIRNDIKNLQKHKLLPAGKFSVTMDRFAGGSSIDVRVVDVDAVMFNTARFMAEIREPHAYRYEEARMTAEGERIMALLKKVVGVYHENKSDIMSDYFNVNFYEHIEARGQEDKERKAFDAAMAEAEVARIDAEDEAERAALLANIDVELPPVDERLLVAKVEALVLAVENEDTEGDEVGPVPTILALAAALRVVEDTAASLDAKNDAADTIEHPGVTEDMLVEAYKTLLA